MRDSNIANNTDDGKAMDKKLKKIAEGWVRLPPKEQNRVIADLTRGLSAKNRIAIENYFRNIARTQSASK